MFQLKSIIPIIISIFVIVFFLLSPQLIESELISLQTFSLQTFSSSPQTSSPRTFTVLKDDGCSCVSDHECYGGYCCFGFCQSTPCAIPPHIEEQRIVFKSYCIGIRGVGHIGFSWRFEDDDGDSQSRFDFRVNDVNNVDAPGAEVDRTFDGLINPTGSLNSQVVSIVLSPGQGEIAYNRTYYWWVRVWDKTGLDSGWKPGPAFTTASHAWPWVSFTWSPKNPVQGEVVEFNPDASQVFGGATIVSYEWTITKGEGEFVDGTTSTYQRPKIVFTTPDNRVSLRITDSSGYWCEKEKAITAQLPLPEWREVPPIIR